MTIFPTTNPIRLHPTTMAANAAPAYDFCQLDDTLVYLDERNESHAAADGSTRRAGDARNDGRIASAAVPEWLFIRRSVACMWAATRNGGFAPTAGVYRAFLRNEWRVNYFTAEEIGAMDS